MADDPEKVPEVYVIDLQDFVDTINDIKKMVRANAEFSRDFKLGSDLVCDTLLDNYSEVIEELIGGKYHKLH